MAGKVVKSLYSISVMAVCAAVCLICGLNLYAYSDLRLNYGIGGYFYALVLLLAAGLFFRSLTGLFIILTAKK